MTAWRRKTWKFCEQFVRFLKRSLSNCRNCADRAQNLPGPAPTFGSHCSRFHPNWFTFGGVIAERVKTVFALWYRAGPVDWLIFEEHHKRLIINLPCWCPGSSSVSCRCRLWRSSVEWRTVVVSSLQTHH